jgi:hypothetical protein
VESDKVINEIGKFFEVHPEFMPIVAGSRGSVAGKFKIYYDDGKMVEVTGEGIF